MKYRKALFIVTFARDKKEIKYLILKRKLHWKGWEFPKGAIEKKESIIKTIKRELKEETGLKELKIKEFNFSGKYNYNRIYQDRPKIKGQTFSLYAVEVKKRKIKVDNIEHNDYKWVDFEKALMMLKWSNQKKSLKIVNKWIKNG
ncbi:MAG: NUDIX domain-containing protein [Nanoarchaeota archaeon]